MKLPAVKAPTVKTIAAGTDSVVESFLHSHYLSGPTSAKLKAGTIFAPVPSGKLKLTLFSDSFDKDYGSGTCQQGQNCDMYDHFTLNN